MATEYPANATRSHRGGLAPSGGSRLSHRHLEAQRTRRRAQIEPVRARAPSITEFSDVALVVCAAISRDLDAARAFVVAQLGDLARDDAKERGERAALLAVSTRKGVW